MNDESIELRNRIIQLPDEELIEMIEMDQSQYREEALVYAEAESQRRGLLPAHAAQEPVVTEAPTLFPSSLKSEVVDGRAEGDSPPAQSAVFRVFRSPAGLWEELFNQAAASRAAWGLSAS